MGLCESCKKAPATFHLTNLTPDGQKIEKHLCEQCAVEQKLVQIHKSPVAEDVLQSFIKGAKTSSAAMSNLVCEHCGTSYLEFRNQGLLGCPHDYDAFKELLAPLLKRAQDGAEQHCGKGPQSLGAAHSVHREIRRLKRQLEEAVTAEDYERAADLRDRIQSLEKS